MEKLCRKCNVLKDEEEFYRQSNGKPTSPCKKCIGGKIAALRATRPQWLTVSQNKENAKRRATTAAKRALGKLCRGCSAILPRVMFYTRRGAAVGRCKPCLAATSAKRYETKAKDILLKNAEWRNNNKEHMAFLVKKWAKENPEKRNASVAERSAAQLMAFPIWANREAIQRIYSEARKRGPQFHVDHIVPLRSKLVCGLHVEHNLQIIPGVDNSSKGNRHWPNMP